MKKTSLISVTCTICVLLALSCSAHAANKDDFSSDRKSIVCEAPLSNANPTYFQRNTISSAASGVINGIRGSFASFAKSVLPKPAPAAPTLDTNIPPPAFTQSLTYKYSILNRDAEIERYIAEEFNTGPDSTGRKSDKPEPVFNLHAVENNFPPTGTPIPNFYEFPKSMAELKQQNKFSIIINHLFTIYNVIPQLIQEGAKASTVVRKLHASLMDGVFLQDIPEKEALEIDFQKAAQKYRFRHDKGLVVGFSNTMAPHGKHMAEIMQNFYNKLDSLIENAKNLSDAVTIAVWARHSILELQPAIDGNTRTARAVMSWVIAAVRNRLGLPFDNTQIDMEDERFPNTKITNVDVHGKAHQYELFSGIGLKGLLSADFISDLQIFSAESGRSFFYLTQEGDPGLEWATNIEAKSLYDSSYLDPSRPEWSTVRAYELKKIELTTLKSLQENPINTVETNALVKALKSAVPGIDF